ncbi:ORF MSV020 hypothetical protein [Melanoplus sanguinipes entomopoxvirus]|uniref:Uncharacterized protein n=1 Tax=Melanoplus sanguinipes entomopoxvirus TaxID=83191 RepID=Q9YW72_MSEPV|nr:ORF MSV020 hypothetical protein [Melanoplus sanguinipes entomopoxvirus]AAC97613.1 ORF MSV020 hypothetical protein [Melanoplus sanguinipes entomopoxvirus 'O']
MENYNVSHITNMFNLLKTPINYKRLEKYFIKNENFSKHQFKELFNFMQKYIYKIHNIKELYLFNDCIDTSNIKCEYIDYKHITTIIKLLEYPINYKSLEYYFIKNENFSKYQFKLLFTHMRKYILILNNINTLYSLKRNVKLEDIIKQKILKEHENLDNQTLQELKNIIDNPIYD